MKNITLYIVPAALLLIVAVAIQYDVRVAVAAESGSSSDKAEKEKAERALRASRRAFYTAPPVIPHKVIPDKSKDCAYCHEEVKETPLGVSMKTPHPQFNNCLQCHVAEKGAVLGEDTIAPVQSNFRGLIEPKEGSRINAGAPPTVPHRLFLRDNCVSCHTPDSPSPRIRTPHQERSQCIQCHVTSSQSEFSLTVPGK